MVALKDINYFDKDTKDSDINICKWKVYSYLCLKYSLSFVNIGALFKAYTMILS